MFHWRDSLYVGRRADGSVRVLKFLVPPPDFPKVEEPQPSAVFDVTIPAGEWASIVAMVTKEGETSEKYYAAVAFHG